MLLLLLWLALVLVLVLVLTLELVLVLVRRAAIEAAAGTVSSHRTITPFRPAKRQQTGQATQSGKCQKHTQVQQCIQQQSPKPHTHTHTHTNTNTHHQAMHVPGLHGLPKPTAAVGSRHVAPAATHVATTAATTATTTTTTIRGVP